MRKRTSQQTVPDGLEQDALEQIARIRRDIFDPGEEKMDRLIRKRGPERALDILQVAVRFNRTLGTVH